uniref:Major facilitator superfamily (MFS) profile domain-containing protein n=1 Tax=Graphocephala atropunctata TaxID=36148 RepID=A0A1B6L9C3_9HEMI
MEGSYNTFLSVDTFDTSTMDSKPSRFRLYFSVAILNLAYIINGTTYAWSSPVLMKLQLTASEGSTVASALSLGMILGPSVCGTVLDRLGRKATLGLSMGFMSGSYLLLTTVSSVSWLSLGRAMAGVSNGIAFTVVPVYIAEISEDAVRGFLNTQGHIAFCFGSLLVYSIGPFVSYGVLHYIMLGMCTLFFLLFIYLPDSPYSLIMKHEVNRARETLTWLRENRSGSYIEKELQIIQSSIHQSQSESGSLKELFASRGNRRGLLICCGLLTLQQVSGMSIVFFYAEQIFQMTGTKISTSTCSIVIGIIMTGSAFISPAAVRNFGYKKPLLVAASGTALGMGSLGVFFLLKTSNMRVDSISWLPLASLVVYIIFFNTGFSNIPWALSGELFPSNVKPYATTLIATSCGCLSFLTAKLFPHLISLVGEHFVFLGCSFFCCLTVAFVSIIVQDTSGLSFGEIQEILNGRKKPDLHLDKAVLQGVN